MFLLTVAFMVVNRVPQYYKGITNVITHRDSLATDKKDSSRVYYWFIKDISVDSILGEPDSIIIKKTLIPIDTSKFTKSEVNMHTESALSFLKELITDNHNDLISREETKMQIRIGYVIILSALITFLLTTNNLSNRRVRNVLMIVILSIYALEIHNYDLYKRSQASLDIKLKASQKLLDSSDVSYKLDIVSLTHQIKYSTRGSLFRKIKTAFIFDTERFIFYIVPLLGFFG